MTRWIARSRLVAPHLPSCRCVLGLILVALTLASCGGAPSSAGTQRTATATALSAKPTPPPAGTEEPTATPFPGAPTPTPGAQPPAAPAIAWVRLDDQHTAQVWASIGGGVPKQVTHNPGTGEPCSDGIFGSPMFSPDLRHIVVAGGTGCTDGGIAGPIYVVTVATGALTVVPASTDWSVSTDERSYGWLDNDTLFWVNGQTGIYEYSLRRQTATQLPLITGASEAVVRGTTLFYLSGGDNPEEFVVHSILHRYSMTSQRDLGTIDLGMLRLCGCTRGNIHLQGWDVSADGSHVVYQVTTPSATVSSDWSQAVGIASSAIFYARADGSNAARILRYMVTNGLVRMRLSPNGQLVAVTNATPAPDVISGCVNSPGERGDPCFHAYTTSAVDHPAWSADNHAFLATRDDAPAPTNGRLNNGEGLYRFTVGVAAGVLFQTSGYNPWSAP